MAKAKTSITTENRSGSAADAAAKEQRTEMPLSDLHPFEGHPFKVLDDELMGQTVESIKQIGVVSPLIVRPDPEGGFEILSGHRRLHAAQLAGLETVPVIVKEMDDDAAIIFMVDSNLQRENILPSERAFSYKMKLEAMKHQAGRPSKENDSQLGNNFGKLSSEEMAEELGTSKNQIFRYIRLTNLIPEILDMVDEKKIAFNPAVELSYLKPADPYTDEDLNYNNEDSRVSQEYADESLRDVELVSDTVENWDSYDTVFIGYPIWWGIAAWPVDTFVDANDFTGKTVIPFATSASSGLGESGQLLAELAGTGDWQEGMRFRSSVSEGDMQEWLDSLSLS